MSAPTLARKTMYLNNDGSWFMIDGEPLASDRRTSDVTRGVSASTIVYVVHDHQIDRNIIERALKSISQAKRIVLR